MPRRRSHLVREKTTIRKMVAIYCRGQHHPAAGICPACRAVLSYAEERIDTCPYSSSAKPVCGLCTSNCFSPEMQVIFKKIMRKAGPRMMVRHPLLSAAHLWDAVRWKRGK